MAKALKISDLGSVNRRLSPLFGRLCRTSSRKPFRTGCFGKSTYPKSGPNPFVRDTLGLKYGGRGVGRFEPSRPLTCATFQLPPQQFGHVQENIFAGWRSSSFLLVLLLALTAAHAQWDILPSGTTSDLRGIH